MQENQPEYQITQPTESRNEELSQALEEIEFLREQVDYLRELVESQKQLLHHTESQLHEVKLELKATNQDLCIALSFSGLVQLTLVEAIALANRILPGKKFTSQSVAKLLTDIYCSPVNPEELKEIDLLSIGKNQVKNDVANEIVAQSKKLRAKSKQIGIQYKELG